MRKDVCNMYSKGLFQNLCDLHRFLRSSLFDGLEYNLVL